MNDTKWICQSLGVTVIETTVQNFITNNLSISLEKSKEALRSLSIKSKLY